MLLQDQSPLAGYRLYEELKQRATDPATRQLLVDVDSMFIESVELSRTIIQYLPQFTLHDVTHLLAVVEMMGRLISDELLATLSPLEIACLILAAGMHDLGLAPSRAEVVHLMDGLGSTEPSETQMHYRRFRERYPRLLKRKEKLVGQGNLFEASEIESYLLGDFFRQTHGPRVRQIIHTRFADRCRYGPVNYSANLAHVCALHVADPQEVEGLPVHELVRSPGEYVNWRFVAILLRLSDILDFDPKRTPQVLFAHLGVRDAVSTREWRKHLMVKAWDIRPTRIAFRADCADPVIQQIILQFIGWIDDELKNARFLLQGMYHPAAQDLSKRYQLDLPANVDSTQVQPERDVQGPRYRYLDICFQLEQESILQIVMGIALYGERTLFLRELLQNAVDACRHRAAVCEYPWQIDVILRDEGPDRVIEVKDNGIGMDENTVRNYFARVGKSYYRSPDFAEQRLGFRPISQFGIGVLSAFMVGDHLGVTTKKAQVGADPLSIEIADAGALFWIRPIEDCPVGTSVTVRLIHGPEEFLVHAPGQPSGSTGTEFQRLQATIAQLAPHVGIPIRCTVGGESTMLVDEYHEPTGYGAFGMKDFLSFSIDLSADAPDGIDGKLTFDILVDPEGTPVNVKILHGLQFDQNGKLELRSDSQYGEAYRMLFGGIYKAEFKRHGPQYTSGGGKLSLRPSGRLSVLGFDVPHSILDSMARPRFSTLPFAAKYDMNLSGDFVLPLTVDRKSVVDSVEAREKIKSLAEILSDLMVDRCYTMIREYPQVFLQLSPEQDPPGASRFTETLLRRLEER